MAVAIRHSTIWPRKHAALIFGTYTTLTLSDRGAYYAALSEARAWYGSNPIPEGTEHEGKGAFGRTLGFSKRVLGLFFTFQENASFGRFFEDRIWTEPRASFQARWDPRSVTRDPEIRDRHEGSPPHAPGKAEAAKIGLKPDRRSPT